MDSPNMYHHQSHEEQLVESSTSSSASLASSCFTTVADNDHTWRTPPFFLNNNGNIHAACGDEGATNSLDNPIIQEMEFPWPNDSISINHQSTSHPNHHHHHHQQLIDDRIKEEHSPSTSLDHHHNPADFAKFSDMLSSSSTSPSDEMLLLKNTLSTSYKNLHHQQPSPFSPSIQYQNAISSNKGISTTFSQIFPTVNISKMSNNNNNNKYNMPSASISSSSSTIDQMASNGPGGFDLFATARLLSGGSSINQSAPSNNNNLLELFDGRPQFCVHHDLQHQSNDLKLRNNIANNVSSFNNDKGQAESKNYNMEQQSTHQMATKKQRFESRSSCPPLKVRKEKLGDRIAALQQLVSPFGKTDTASVLMEAIGYIKFLQNQVETLSVPYMKLASHSKSSNNTQKVSNDEYCENEEPKLTDLKSRGLCLVPTSCMSYINIASDPINGGVWPPSYHPTSGF